MKTLTEIENAPHVIWDEKNFVADGVVLAGRILFERWEGTIILGTNEDGYEHVSVSPRKKTIIPTWEDMCRVKNLFWKEDEEAYQIHPKKSEYVNVMQNCLHLWKPVGHELSELVKR